MKRMLVCLTLLLAFKSCQKAPQNARDTAAALKGALVTAQQQYQSECQKTPSESYCQTINRAHDNLKRQQVVNDKLYRQWRMAETRLARAEKRVIWLWAALGATWASWIGVIWWVSQQLAPVVWKALQSPK